jgi:hypothetical protein
MRTSNRFELVEQRDATVPNGGFSNGPVALFLDAAGLPASGATSTSGWIWMGTCSAALAIPAFPMPRVPTGR